MTALPRRVRARTGGSDGAGEPADSVLHRLATRWGMSRSEFERFVGVDPARAARGAHAEIVASLAGFEPDALVAATPSRAAGSRRMRIGAAWTDLSDLAGRAQRFCPSCLADDRDRAAGEGAPVSTAAWSRAEWSVRSIATCAVHGALLLAACPACGARAGPDNPAVDRCRCGAELHGASAGGFRSEVDAALRLAISHDPPDWFLGAGLHQASSHLTRLGALLRGWSARRPEPDAEGSLGLREEGLALLLGGEAPLAAALDAIVAGSRPGASGRPGLTSAYGWAWGAWLGVPTVNPLDAALRDAVRSHAEAAGIAPPRRAGGVTLERARTVFGAGHDRARRLVANAGLLSGCELPGVPMSLDRGGVEALASDLGSLLDAAAGAAELGIDRTRFRALVRAGLVRSDRRAEALGAGVLYGRAPLRALVDAVSRDASRLDRPPSGCHALPVACRNASVPLAALLAALLDGRLHAVARTPGHGLAGVWVSVAEVSRLAPPRPSTRAAARALGVHYEAARWLVAEGHLGPRPGVAAAAAVQAFGDAFCTSAQAGASIGVSAKSFAARQRALGRAPAFGPPACRQALWRRDGVAAGGRPG